MENVLIVLDNKDAVQERGSKQWNVYWHRLDYKNIEREVMVLRNIIAKKNIDFIVFSRNEQSGVPIGKLVKKLEIGYSSISGINRDSESGEMKRCLEDFLMSGIRLAFVKKKPIPAPRDHKRMFSLVFDMEQVGGSRYGLFPLLGILREYNIRATFFVTNMIKKTYRNIIDILVGEGHEVGIHGYVHEPLSSTGYLEQEASIKRMLHDFKKYNVKGANFIGRMNGETIRSMTVNGLVYFVHPMKNTVAPLSVKPEIMAVHSEKIIYMVPISVETYNNSWQKIRQQIDNTLKTGAEHISILLHPFYDGRPENRENVVKMINYLLNRGVGPAQLSVIVARNRIDKPTKFVDYSIETVCGTLAGLKRKWYEKKIVKRYERLKANGGRPALRVIK